MEKNNEQEKNIWKPLCLVLAALLALSWVFFGFLYSKGGVDFSALENSEQSYTVDGGAIIGEGESNGIALMSAEIPVEEFAEYDVSPMAETAYTLTATITPVNAVDKTVDWSVSFVNPESEWATGKTVTDYVTVTPTSDGALTATVECLQAFGEQVTVTVTSRDVETVSANCVCNYVKRVAFISSATSSDLLMYSDGKYVVSVNFGEDKDIVFKQPSYTLGVGTVEPSIIFGSRRAVVNETWLDYVNGFTAVSYKGDIYFEDIAGTWVVHQEDLFYEFFNNMDNPLMVSSFIDTVSSDSTFRRYAVGFCCDYEVTYNGETFGSGTWWYPSYGGTPLEPYWFDISVDSMQTQIADIELSESELAY